MLLKSDCESETVVVFNLVEKEKRDDMEKEKAIEGRL